MTLVAPAPAFPCTNAECDGGRVRRTAVVRRTGDGWPVTVEGEGPCPDCIDGFERCERCGERAATRTTWLGLYCDECPDPTRAA